jgi:hypothetical protein
MTIRLLILILFLFAATSSLWGQQAATYSEDAYVSLDLEEINEGSNVHLQQIGDFNYMLVEQSNQHTVMASQRGNHNFMDIQLLGADNLITADQRGDHNIYQLYFSGSDSELRVGQDGEDNTLIQDFRDVRGLDITVEQTGKGNSLEMSETGFGPMSSPLLIQQSGGAQLQISNLKPFLNP